MATYGFHIDWDADGDHSDDGETVTARVLDRSPVEIRYGRDQARALAPAAPGEASFELDNASRDYYPDNTGSPLAGLVLPGRSVLIDADLAYTSDTFAGRTVSSGWGTSSSGHVWTTAGGSASNFAVASGVATITLTSVNVSRRCSLAASGSSCRTAATISVDAVATGAAIRVAVAPRATDLSTDHQRAQLNFELSGALSISLVERVAGSDTTLATFALVDTYSAGTQVSVVAEASGTTLRARAWLAAGTEPTTWQVTQQVDLISAVEVGVRAISATGNTNTNPVLTIDDWSSTLHADLFRGHIDEFTLLPEVNRRSVQVTCLDPLARLRDVRVTTDLYQGIQTGQAIGYLLDAVGWDPDLRDLDWGATTIRHWWLDDADAFTALQQIVASEGPPAMVHVDADGRIVFRDRHHRLIRPASVTSQVTLRDTGAEPNHSPPMVYDPGLRDIVNTVSVPVEVRTAAGHLSAVWQNAGLLTVADGQTIQVVARASNPFIGAVVPVAGIDYTLVSGTINVALSRTSGQSTTVSVQATGGPAVVADLQVRAFELPTTTTVQVAVEETVSIGRYGRRSLPSGSDPVWANANDALAVGEVILAHRAERMPAITVTVTSGVNGDPTRMTHILARDLSDRVTLVDAETGLDTDCYVEQIQHIISEAGMYHQARLGLEKVPTQPSGVLVLDDAALGLLNTGTLGSVGLSDPATVFVLDDATSGELDAFVLGY